MNALQFYYVNTVLGISSFLQPQEIRSTYRLLYGSTKNPDFLFFCDSLKNNGDKTLIQKISKALGSDQYIIVEILNQHSLLINIVLNNLLTRFLPKCFVIFGPDLGFKLTNKNFFELKDPSVKQTENIPIKISKTISIKKNLQKPVYGCILHPLTHFTGSNLSKVQENKKQAWKILKELYP